MILQYTKKDIENLYIKQRLSWAEIAKIYNTNPNNVRRQAIKLGIKSRTKSEAQSEALLSNRHNHPTKGTHRPDDVKIKISDGMADVWANLTNEERESRSEQAREQWENMSELERKEFQHAAAVAIREAAKSGSKLEKFLLDNLRKLGYHIEYHKTHFIINENVHLDLFLPKLNVAIEIDGPSHSENIWGLKNLQRTKRTDAEKSGLILNRGMVLIRIKSIKAISNKYQRTILEQLVEKLKIVEKKYPDKNNRYITIGDK